MRLLLVEDERRLLELLRCGLNEEGHSVVCACDGNEAWLQLREQNFDVIILDIMMPGMDGFALARQLREENNRTPVLMLTARDSVPDIVKGLALGADDYMTKPFSFAELLLRLRAVHRPIAGRRKAIQIQDLVLDRNTRKVHRDGTLITLTRTEYALLERLMCDAGRVLSRELLIASVWGANSVVESNTLDAFVKLLRNKVDNGREPLIHTVRGRGYVLGKQAWQ